MYCMPSTVCPQLKHDPQFYFSLGGKGSGLPFHNHLDAFQAAVVGRKRWLLVEPRQKPLLSTDDISNRPLPGMFLGRATLPKPTQAITSFARLHEGGSSNLTMGEARSTWLRDVLPALPADERPLECWQEEGDVMFVPATWEHMTVNEGDAVGLSWVAEAIPPAACSKRWCG